MVVIPKKKRFAQARISRTHCSISNAYPTQNIVDARYVTSRRISSTPLFPAFHSSHGIVAPATIMPTEINRNISLYQGRKAMAGRILANVQNWVFSLTLHFLNLQRPLFPNFFILLLKPPPLNSSEGVYS